MPLIDFGYVKNIVSDSGKGEDNYSMFSIGKDKHLVQYFLEPNDKFDEPVDKIVQKAFRIEHECQPTSICA